MKVWLQNRLVDEAQARLSVMDHGFLYGDGVYETVHAYGARIFHWEDHLERLRESARRIALRCPWSSAYLEKALRAVMKANKMPSSSLRITLSRGPGALGLSPRLCRRPTLVILPHPERDVKKLWEKGISIGIVAVRRNHPECLDPQIKSNNSLNTILAKIEADAMGVEEAVLLNLKGEITEGTISNLFFVKRGELFTPSLECGILAGVTRRLLIEMARRGGMTVHEGRYTPKDLVKADECFLSNSTWEVVSVVSVAQYESERQYAVRRRVIGTGQPGPVARRLHELYRDAVRSERKVALL